ncbi:hypothetical protein CRUP_021387 [Coryphaenoides rupestris]|nr:hypothetical protein CRUP_021387 [Coryphaenoides rupestris]
MSLRSLLRCAAVRRVERTHFVPQRAISGADAFNALRPFYFAVHPDFFGQYPMEREVNENSLKRLNGYLENLQKPGRQSTPPTQLTFYVRETQDNGDRQPDVLPPGFRAVSFTLHTNDVLSTVTDVLRSCRLSLEHVKNFADAAGTEKPNKGAAEAAGAPFYRPIKWDKTYYSFTGFRDPEQELHQAKQFLLTFLLRVGTQDISLFSSLWLRKNEPEATKRHDASLPRRNELGRLRTELCHKFSLADIRWQRSWGITHRCCQLQSLSRLSQQNPEALRCLQGHTVVFTDQSGMNASGHVTLGTMDVHQQWVKLMERLPGYHSLQQQCDWLQERVSVLLGGARIVHVERVGPVQPIDTHYHTLSAFHKRLVSHRRPLRLHPRSLQGLSMTLENDRSTPSLHEMGHFILPTNCDPPRLQAFLQSHALEARQLSQRKQQLQSEEDVAVAECLEGLSLRGLSKDPSVTSSQMLTCCRRLLEQRPPLAARGLYVCVSHFYSVMLDGDLCIPWDWKG